MRLIRAQFFKVQRITPQTVKKTIRNILASIYEADYLTVPIVSDVREEYRSRKEIPGLIQKLKTAMKEAATRLEFERATELRDRIHRLEEVELKIG